MIKVLATVRCAFLGLSPQYLLLLVAVVRWISCCLLFGKKLLLSTSQGRRHGGAQSKDRLGCPRLGKRSPQWSHLSDAWYGVGIRPQVPSKISLSFQQQEAVKASGLRVPGSSSLAYQANISTNDRNGQKTALTFSNKLFAQSWPRVASSRYHARLLI